MYTYSILFTLQNGTQHPVEVVAKNLDHALNQIRHMLYSVLPVILIVTKIRKHKPNTDIEHL